MSRRLIAVGIAAIALVTPGAAVAGGLELTGQTVVNPRLLQFDFETAAIAGGTGARVLLPPGYDATKRRYPVLYLFHGAGYDETSWSGEGEVESIVGDRRLIVVMPRGGGNGYYTDWYNGGDFGPPAYETFHVSQLIPWIDDNFRTRAGRKGRITAGFSMGGFGAMNYAARHPGLFSGAFSFSGAIDTNYAPFQVIGEASSLADGGAYGAIFGQRQAQEVRWRARNPWDLAPNLKGMTLQLRTGNGLGGGEFGGPPIDPIEFGVHEMAISMDARLTDLGFPHYYEDYGPGAHEFPYYRRDLSLSMPAIMASFRNPPKAPRRFTFRAVEPAYSAYGYRVHLDRPELEFSELDARRSGKRFTLRGSGRVRVVTPPRLRPRALYSVRVDGDAGQQRRTLRADRRGRIRLSVSLGPANPAQQYTVGATTVVREATVRLRRRG